MPIQKKQSTVRGEDEMPAINKAYSIGDMAQTQKERPVVLVYNPEQSKRQVDWEAIYREYRAGLLSVREIAKMFGITHGAIQKRAKKFPEQWKRDLSGRVRDEIRRMVVADPVASGDEEEIIDAAADRALGIIREHRKSIKKLAEAETRLLAELQGKPKKVSIHWVGKKACTEEVAIAATERATALLAVASTQAKRIQMERQAFGIDDDAKPEEKKIDGIFIHPVAGVAT